MRVCGANRGTDMLKAVEGCEARELGLEEVVEVVERDLPTLLWGVWRCDCGSPEGRYAARMCTADFDPSRSTGWNVGTHGTTAANALGAAYTQASMR
jgi:hypothetical protein